MDHSKPLGEENISKLLFKFSVPAVIGMLVNASYNVIDRIFVGRGVGALALAGLTISFPLMILIMAFGMLIGLGSTALISIRLGQQKKEEAEKILANGFILLVFVSICISILGLLLLNPLLQVFGASSTVLPYASQYLSIILLGAVFQGVGFGMNNFIRAEGNPRIAMITMLISAFTNIILDPIFIFLLDMGIKGAALATIIAQGISAVWVLYYFIRGKSLLKLRYKNLKLQSNIVKNILAIGSAPFAMQLAASLMNVILNNSLVAYGGDIAVSAMGIVNSIAMMMLMPIFGLNQGSQPIIGYNYGAKKFSRVKSALKLTITVATSVVLVGFIISRVFPTQLIQLFNKEPELINLGTEALTMFFLFLPLIGFQIVSANYFQAVGKPKHAMFLSLSRQFLLLIPSLLILPRFFGLVGVFMAAPVSDLGSSMLTGFWIYREIRQLGFKGDQSPLAEPVTDIQ